MYSMSEILVQAVRNESNSDLGEPLFACSLGDAARAGEGAAHLEQRTRSELQSTIHLHHPHHPVASSRYYIQHRLANVIIDSSQASVRPSAS
jgi:hypothetical protein